MHRPIHRPPLHERSASRLRLPRTRSTRTRYWGGTFALSVILAGIAPLFGFSPVSSFLAFTLLAICGFPTYEYMRQNSREVPAIPVLTGAFALQMALPVFTGERLLPVAHSVAELSEDMIVSALLLANLGAIVLVTICTSRFARQAVSVLPTLQLHLNRSRAILFCIIFGALAVVMTAVGPAGDFGALSRVIRNQSLVIIVLLAWLRYDTGALWARIAWYGVLGVALLVGMSTLFIEAVVAPIAVMFLCIWLYTGRISKLLVVAAFAAILFLNPGKGEVRQNVWGSQASISIPVKAGMWLQSSTSFWWRALLGETQASDGVKAAAMRSNHLYLLARIVERTPHPTPYLEGETYAFFFYSWIPRAVWPEKPRAEANGLLAVRYLLTTEESAEQNTFGVGLLGEGYANFGTAGVIFISAVLGIVLLIMLRLFGSANAGAGGAAIVMSFFIYFLNGLGSSAEILFGNLFQSMLTSYVLLYWVAERSASGRHTPSFRRG